MSLGGLEIARDGSGALVFSETVSGVSHVFASRLLGGTFQPPAELDAGLPGASSQPVVTGTSNGVAQVAFINGGNLYVTGTSSPATGWSAPQALASGAADPAISMNTYGEAYLAFTATAGGGFDVDVEYFNGSTWSAASPEAVNATPGDAAGTGAGRPVIAAAGDGVAVVAWGENGHVYSRRVWGTQTSVELERLDPATWGGWSEVAADSPSVGVGGDSSYSDIAFREQLASGGQTQSRVLLTRLVAENTQSPVAIDGLTTPGSDSADQPVVAMNEYGRGFATVATESTDYVLATTLTTNGGAGSHSVIGSGVLAPYTIPNGLVLPPAPFAVPASAGLISTLIAWQQSPPVGGSQIVVRYAQDGSDLAPAQAVPGSVGSNAAAGLAAGGDVNGDAAVAWVQGSSALETVDVAQLYQPPSAPTASAGVVYTRLIHPALTWSASHDVWGPLTYSVTLDGAVLGQTTGTSIAVPATLVDGPHVWQVKVTNPAGLSATSGRATTYVDTQPPRMRIVLSGVARAGRPVTLRLATSDPANPSETGSQASGVASVTVRWGLRGTPTSETRVRAIRHVFTSPGLDRVTVTVTDRAGNATTIARFVRILPAV